MPTDIANKALKLAAYKLPVKTTIISKLMDLKWIINLETKI